MARPDRDEVMAINVAIGNVSLPMHQAMQERMFNLGASNSPFKDGVVRYTPTVGLEETNRAALNIIAASGINPEGLYSQITNGASEAMELVIKGTCGRFKKDNQSEEVRPLLLIDPAYTNYPAFAQRLEIPTISFTRHLKEDGKFTLPAPGEIERIIKKHHPGALVVIPYDNPTGQFFNHQEMAAFAQSCVEHNLWLISDESYRELSYVGQEATSVWRLTEEEVPGITGRRIGFESASKVFNACGLRIGALVTDNKEFHEKAVAEYTANLCANAIGQYIFGALAHLDPQELGQWFARQRSYYGPMIQEVTSRFREVLPGVVVSLPQASIYSVVDVRRITRPGFDARDFVLDCAEKGKVNLEGRLTTLLVAPMAGFYSVQQGEENPGRTQMRIAYVEPPKTMRIVPELLASLLHQYEAQRS